MEELHTANVKTVSVEDVRISGYESDYVFRYIESSRDFYEADLLRAWTPLLNQPQYVLDVGANLGNHTVYWAKHLQPKRIVAFEPFADNYQLLQRNVRINQLDCVTALEIAVGDREGWAEVAEFHPDNYGGTSFRYTEGGESAARVCSLDHMVEQLRLPQVDFVKIDTEGFELPVLRGMRHILEKERPALWIEAGKDTVADIWDLLAPLQYRLAAMSAANLLFLPGEKRDAPVVTWKQVLESNFAFLEKVNVYYANYEKSKAYGETLKKKLEEAEQNYQRSKDWLAQRMEELQKERDRVSEVREKLAAYQSDYETCKGWLAQRTEDLQRERDRLDEMKKKAAAYQTHYETCKGWLAQRTEEKEACQAALKQREEELARLKDAKLDEALVRCLLENDRSVELLHRAGRTIQQLQAQNAYLKTENENYARKFAKITGTWYGSLGLKCYHWLQKRKWKLQALGRKLRRVGRGERK